MIGVPNNLTKEKVEQLEKKGKVRYISYGFEDKFFGIAGKNLYTRNSDGSYSILTRNFGEE